MLHAKRTLLTRAIDRLGVTFQLAAGVIWLVAVFKFCEAVGRVLGALVTLSGA
jgi:hypothetical protein